MNTRVVWIRVWAHVLLYPCKDCTGMISLRAQASAFLDGSGVAMKRVTEVSQNP